MFGITGYFFGPAGYVGMPPADVHQGHLNVWATPLRGLQQGYVGCLDGRRQGSVHVEGRTMTWIACPPGSEIDSDHILLEWQKRDIYYAVSAHGNNPANRVLLRFLASHLVRSK